MIDGLLIVVLNKTLHSHQNAMVILKAFITDFEAATGHSLNIIFADAARTYHIFENTVINTGSRIVIKFHLKSYKSLRENDVQIIKKGVHPGSAISTEVKINTMLNTFMRIRNVSSFDSFAIISVLQYTYEVRVAYSWDESWVMRALFKI